MMIKTKPSLASAWENWMSVICVIWILWLASWLLYQWRFFFSHLDCYAIKEISLYIFCTYLIAILCNMCKTQTFINYNIFLSEQMKISTQLAILFTCPLMAPLLYLKHINSLLPATWMSTHFLLMSKSAT